MLVDDLGQFLVGAVLGNSEQLYPGVQSFIQRIQRLVARTLDQLKVEKAVADKQFGTISDSQIILAFG